MLRMHQFDGAVDANGSGETNSAGVGNVAVVAPSKRASVARAVLQVVNDAPAPMEPGEVQEILSNRGIDADLNNVRQALRRWVEREQLVKRGRLLLRADRG